MPTDFDGLTICPDEVEDLMGLRLPDRLAMALHQAIASRSRAQKLSLLMAEGFALGLTLIFGLPLGLIGLRRAGHLTESTPSTTEANLILLLVGLAIALVGLGNVILLRWGQPLKPLARLLGEIERFNQVIRAIRLMHPMDRADAGIGQTSDRQELIHVLVTTRTSLINALTAEVIRQRHQSRLSGHPDLMANFEKNLTELMAFQVDNPTSDYGRMLNDVLDIGLRVHRELRKR